MDAKRQTQTAATERWSSKASFFYATAAAAIGLGSLWRFPYVAGANGGGAFIIIYIALVSVFCIPLMIAEMSMGRHGHGSAVGSVSRLVSELGASPFWKAIGWFSVSIPFFGLSYYSVVAGWAVDYTREAVFNGFAGLDANEVRDLFSTLIGSPWRQGFFQFAFIFTAAAVVAAGVQRGIEVISKVKMSALFFVLIGLVIYNATTVGLGPSLEFLLKPDFSMISTTTVMTAVGQALFSTAIGSGVLMTYSAYLPDGVSIPKSSGLVAASVLFISLMAGLAIFPIVLANGLTPAEGPNLIFVTLPVAFGSMPGGRIASILFFGLISLGAFTTAVGLLEPVTAWLIERTGFRRGPMAFLAAGGIWLVGLPSLLSFSILKDVHPLEAIPAFAGKTFFAVLDFGITETLLPFNALLIALFAGWVLKSLLTPRETDLPPFLHRLWHIFVAFLAPAAIIVLMIDIFAK